jgi:hypothetical protein
MRESYTEGVATHGGPESCVGSRKGVDEALTGVRAGWVWSREIRLFRAPTSLCQAEGHTPGRVSASSPVALRGRRPHACTESPCARTGRSSDRLFLMVGRAAPERLEAVSR